MSEEKKTIADRLSDALDSPSEYQASDGERVQQRSADEIIKLARFQASEEASRRRRPGFRITRMEHGGSL